MTIKCNLKEAHVGHDLLGVDNVDNGLVHGRATNGAHVEAIHVLPP